MFNVPLHLLFVHFPIALAVVAAIIDVRTLVKRLPEFSHTSAQLNLWAAAGAAMAMLTGLQVLGDRSRSSQATLHASLGLVAGLILMAVAMVRYSANTRESDHRKAAVEAWLVLEVLAAVVVVGAAFTGHRLVLGSLGR